MNTRKFIIMVAVLLAFSPAASAQQQIQDLFREITAGKEHGFVAERRSTYVNDTTGIKSESRMVIVNLNRQHLDILDRLKAAFASEGQHATLNYSHIIDDASGSLQPIARQRFSIWCEGMPPVIIGAIRNSNFLIVSFDDKNHPGYRTCLAAEWSNTESDETPQAMIVDVYGRKQEAQTVTSSLSANGTMSWQEFTNNLLSNSKTSDDIKQRLAEIDQWRDSLASNIDIPNPSLSDYTAKFSNFNDVLQNNIPTQGGKKYDWMQQASNNDIHLDASDWLRFFGLMTHHMLERKDDDSYENLVVAAGIILELCKNATPLDADERAISARRLEQVAANFKDQYIHDILILGAKKLKGK